MGIYSTVVFLSCEMTCGENETCGEGCKSCKVTTGAPLSDSVRWVGKIPVGGLKAKKLKSLQAFYRRKKTVGDHKLSSK